MSSLPLYYTSSLLTSTEKIEVYDPSLSVLAAWMGEFVPMSGRYRNADTKYDYAAHTLYVFALQMELCIIISK